MRLLGCAAAAALLAWLSLATSPVRAEADGFFLGSGRDGALTVATANTIINAYAPIMAPVAPGDTAVTIGSPLGVGSFASGDLVMLWQTTGVVPEPASGTAGPFALGAAGVGHWELVRVSGASGGTLNLTAPVLAAFPANASQAVRVPEYSAITVNSTGSLRALAWNGSVGGIVAALATGTLTNNATAGITANFAGFRGGSYVDDPSSLVGCQGLDEASPQGARKGEGIAVTRYGPAQSGRGRVANGAGGGECYLSGGGGGGNGGSGGQGGNSEFGVDGGRTVGGQGGGALATDSERRMLLLGGGGGAGHGNSGGAAAGAAGGGVVFLRVGALSGGGLLARGAVAPGVSTSDAGGGGGAGGTIHLRASGTVTCALANASGGLGGNTAAYDTGPGGGGGGGRALLQSAGGLCTPQVAGAAAGTQADPAAPGGVSYGAGAGGAGVSLTLPGAYGRAAAPNILAPTNGSSTNNPMPTVVGSGAQAGRGVAIYIDGALKLTPTADASGNFSASVGNLLADGAHYLQAAVYDEGDLGLPSAVTLFTVDTTPPPAPAIIAPVNGSTTSLPQPLIKGSAAIGISVAVRIDGSLAGSVMSNGVGDWQFTPAPLADGVHTVKARATDAAGNTGADSSTITFTVDTTPPPAPVVVTPAQSSITNDSTPLVTGTAEPASTVSVLFDSALVGSATTDASGNWSFTPSTPLADGDHSVAARATDAAGNTGPNSAANTFTVDTTPPPAPTITAPADGSTTVLSQPPVTGNADRNSSSVTVLIDGAVVATVPTAAHGQWQFTPAPLPDGVHTVRARQTDPAGNTGVDSATNTFTVLSSDRLFADGFE